MKSAKTQLFTFIFIISHFLANSQTILQGKVKDAFSGDPIISAEITISKNDRIITITETDDYGNYKFKNIDSGQFDIEASRIGYLSQKQKDININRNETNIIHFEIQKHREDRIIVKKPSFTKEPALPINMSNAMTSMDISKSSKPMVIRGSSSNYKNNSLPSSGQITAGEWNDLHNWKDWTNLLTNEEYKIMTNRFEIYPTSRYSVLTINENNSVIPNIKVQLKNGNNIVWEAVSDNSGKAELWASPYSLDTQNDNYSIIVGDQKIEQPKSIEEGTNTIIINQECNSPQKMDIVFTVDATSSMMDEIDFLKSELLDVIDRIEETNESISYRTGSVFYRDTRDTYLTKVSPLSSNKDNIISFVKEQNANGGGDKPEAVEEALDKTLHLDWEVDALKIVFLILDAPPHEDNETMAKIRSQIMLAAKKGIKIIPITASGIGRETEFLMKFMSIMTNGTYIFITDDSGIGNPHLAPVVSDYEVEKLNDCMVRLISQYSKSYSCEQNKKYDHIDIKVYPNPSVHYLNVETEVIPNKINILSSNGMVVKTITNIEKLTRIELNDLVNGVYTLAIFFDDRVESRQVIVLH